MDANFRDFLKQQVPPSAYDYHYVEQKDIDVASSYSKEHFPDMPLTHKYLSQILVKGHGVGVFLKDKTKGDIAASIFCELNSRNKRIYISEVIVSEAHREKGLGRNLIKLFETFGVLNDYHRLCSNIAVTNINSMHLHQKMGFKKERLERTYFDDGSDAFYMVKMINS